MLTVASNHIIAELLENTGALCKAEAKEAFIAPKARWSVCVRSHMTHWWKVLIAAHSMVFIFFLLQSTAAKSIVILATDLCQYHCSNLCCALQVTDEVAQHLKAAGVEVKPYEQLVEDVQKVAQSQAKIWADPSKVC